MLSRFQTNVSNLLIMIFQFSLLICIFLIIEGQNMSANEVAKYGYYMLSLGILIKLTLHNKNRNNPI